MAEAEKMVELRIIADGVFVAEDVRHDTGDIVKVSASIAKVLIDGKFAKNV
jgi:hypothetical protein